MPISPHSDHSDQFNRWEEDFLQSSGSWVSIERPRKGKVSFTQHGDIRLELEHRANMLEEAIRGQLNQELAELRSEIMDQCLPPKVATDQFEHRAKRLEKRCAERSSELIEKLLVKFDADRLADSDPERGTPYDARLTLSERKKLHGRYLPVCKEVCRAATLHLQSSVLSGYAGQADIVRAARREVIVYPNKGNLDVLCGPDGRKLDAVARATAVEYLGMSERSVFKALAKGTLLTKGRGLNKKITVESLIAYLTPTAPQSP